MAMSELLPIFNDEALCAQLLRGVRWRDRLHVEVMKDVQHQTIRPLIESRVSDESLFSTDDYGIYNWLAHGKSPKKGISASLRPIGSEYNGAFAIRCQRFSTVRPPTSEK